MNIHIHWEYFSYLLAEADERRGFELSLPSWWSRNQVKHAKTRQKAATAQIGALPVETQESELVRDVLALLIGFSSTNMLTNMILIKQNRLTCNIYVTLYNNR